MKLFGIGSEIPCCKNGSFCVAIKRDEVGNWTVVDNLGDVWFLSDIEELLQLNSPH